MHVWFNRDTGRQYESYMKNIRCSFCDKPCDVFELSKESVKNHLINNDSKFFDLIIYFEYLTPNTSSILSETIDDKLSENILNEILSCGFKQNNNYEFVNTSITEELLSTYSLNGDDIYSSCKRFVCNVSSYDKKNKLSALLRHIRNSIAHGRYYILKSGSYYKFLFEDKYNKKTTFRMCINHSTLRKWKNILIDNMKDNQK